MVQILLRACGGYSCGQDILFHGTHGNLRQSTSELLDLIFSYINSVCVFTIHLPENHPNIILLSTLMYPKLIKSNILICLKESLPSWTFVTNQLGHSTRQERHATTYEAHSAWSAGSLYGSWQGKRGCKFTTAFGERWTFPSSQLAAERRATSHRRRGYCCCRHRRCWTVTNFPRSDVFGCFI